MRKLQAAATQPVPDFLRTLQEEHRYFQSLIDIAIEQHKLLEEDGNVDLDILQELLQYLTEYPEDYHHPREDMMFDRLREVDPGSSEHIDKLLQGHETIHDASNKLYFAVMRANNGENIHRGKMARDLKHFIDGYEKHMHDEDGVVFVRALQALNDDDWEQLDEGLEHIDDPLFGTRVRRRYRRLANTLEARLGVAKRDLVAAEYLSLGALIDGFITLSDTTVNIGYILRDKTGQTFRENMDATREGIQSGSFVKFVKLPTTCGGNALRNARDGLKETRELVRKAVDDLRTPYNMRVDTLKEILREDFGS